MDINLLKEHLSQTISLKLELKELKQTDRRSLSAYLDQFRSSLSWTDFGDRDKFWLPYHYATEGLKYFDDIKTNELDMKFTVNKTKLLSIVTRHIKDLQSGFREYDLESPLTRDNPGIKWN
jgi:hypothetical protein